MDCGLPGSSICGIFQARALEWLTFPSPVIRQKFLKILEPLHLPVFAEGPADCPHCSVWDSATNLCLNSCASDFHIYFSTLGLLFIPPVKELFWKSLFLLKVLAKQPYIA